MSETALASSVDRPIHRRPRASKAARRLREIVDGLRADLGHSPDTSEAALIEQAAMLIVQREVITAKMLRGEVISTAEITKITGAITRCLAAFHGKDGGKQRPPKLPSLAEYAARKAAEKAASASLGVAT